MSSLEAPADVWDRFAAAYAQRLQNGPSVPVARAMLDSLNTLSSLSAATGVIDIGCGPGIVVRELLSRYSLPPDTRIVASDYSPGMVAQVAKRAEEEVGKGNAVWQRLETSTEDAHDLAAHADGSFSHATAGLVMFMLSDAQKAMRSVLRVLAPCGVFALSSWATTEWMDITGVLTSLHPHMKIPGLPEAWTSVQGVKGQMETAGFNDVDVYKLKVHFEYDTPEEVVEFMTKSLPALAVLMKDLSGEEAQKVRDAMVAWLKARRGEGKSSMEGTALVGVGRK